MFPNDKLADLKPKKTASQRNSEVSVSMMKLQRGKSAGKESCKERPSRNGAADEKVARMTATTHVRKVDLSFFSSKST